MEKKIYISGKMTGLSKEEIDNNFNKGVREVKKLGFIPVNPNDIPAYFMNGKNDNPTYEEWIRGDLIELCKCHAIYMLRNWQDSTGAKIEMRVAIDLNMEILFQS